MNLRHGAALALGRMVSDDRAARSIPEGCLNGLVDKDLYRAYMTMPGLPFDTNAGLASPFAGFDSGTACAQARKKAIDADAQQLAARKTNNERFDASMDSAWRGSRRGLTACLLEDTASRNVACDGATRSAAGAKPNSRTHPEFRHSDHRTGFLSLFRTAYQSY